jgi:hypothetical protein
VAFARKGEHDIPELTRRERAYRALFRRLPHGRVIRNGSLEAAREELLTMVFGRFQTD